MSLNLSFTFEVVTYCINTGEEKKRTYGRYGGICYGLTVP